MPAAHSKMSRERFFCTNRSPKMKKNDLECSLLGIEKTAFQERTGEERRGGDGRGGLGEMSGGEERRGELR